MDDHFKQIVEKYQERVAQGAQREDGAASLSKDGYSTIEAIGTIRLLFKMSLREAIELIVNHPTWVEAARTNKEASPGAPGE
jgi:hypothetical protein